jgi:hypothetical protein
LNHDAHHPVAPHHTPTTTPSLPTTPLPPPLATCHRRFTRCTTRTNSLPKGSHSLEMTCTWSTLTPTRPPAHPPTHSLTRSLSHMSTHMIHPPIHMLTHPLTRSLSHMSTYPRRQLSSNTHRLSVWFRVLLGTLALHTPLCISQLWSDFGTSPLPTLQAAAQLAARYRAAIQLPLVPRQRYSGEVERAHVLGARVGVVQQRRASRHVQRDRVAPGAFNNDTPRFLPASNTRALACIVHRTLP